MPPFSRLMSEGKRAIPGTLVFDGDAAQAGFAINAMCYSFNDAANRAAFLADEEAYMARFDLSEEQREAVRGRDVSAMLASGGNVYYLAKLAGILGLNVQELGALQTGMTVDDFNAALMSHAVTETRVSDDISGGKVAA